MGRQPKVHFVSLGCAKNLVDSEVMLGHLVRDGFQLVDSVEDAEVIVVNTCGFIDAAKEESVDVILEMAQYKIEGRCKKLIVAGCLSQRYAPDLAKEIPVPEIYGDDGGDVLLIGWGSTFGPIREAVKSLLNKLLRFRI